VQQALLNCRIAYQMRDASLLQQLPHYLQAFGKQLRPQLVLYEDYSL